MVKSTIVNIIFIAIRAHPEIMKIMIDFIDFRRICFLQAFSRLWRFLVEFYLGRINIDKKLFIFVAIFTCEFFAIVRTVSTLDRAT